MPVQITLSTYYLLRISPFLTKQRTSTLEGNLVPLRRKCFKRKNRSKYGMTSPSTDVAPSILRYSKFPICVKIPTELLTSCELPGIFSDTKLVKLARISGRMRDGGISAKFSSVNRVICFKTVKFIVIFVLDKFKQVRLVNFGSSVMFNTLLPAKCKYFKFGQLTINLLKDASSTDLAVKLVKFGSLSVNCHPLLLTSMQLRNLRDSNLVNVVKQSRPG